VALRDLAVRGPRRRQLAQLLPAGGQVVERADLRIQALALIERRARLGGAARLHLVARAIERGLGRGGRRVGPRRPRPDHPQQQRRPHDSPPTTLTAHGRRPYINECRPPLATDDRMYSGRPAGTSWLLTSIGSSI